MTDRTRLETLIQAHLDGELAAEERDELAAAVEGDPAARRLFDEYVALEGLLFAVGTSDRGAVSGPAPRRDSRRDPRPRPAAWLVPALAAVALLALVWTGIPERVETPAPRAAEPLRVTALSPGHLAVAVPCEHPDVQIVWLYRVEPRPEGRELR